ncbi:Sensor histidine kinase RcsC [Candidatus Hepatincola sp. Av]
MNIKKIVSKFFTFFLPHIFWHQIKRQLLKLRFFIKQFLPKTLLFRTLIILATTLLVLQLILAIIFYDNHWRILRHTLTENLSLTISEIVRQATEADNTKDIQKIINYYNQVTSLKIKMSSVEPSNKEKKINKSSAMIIANFHYLIPNNKIYINRYNINYSAVIITIKIKDDIYLIFNLKTDLFFISSFYYLLLAFILFYILTITVVWQFVRLQIRPLQQLSKYAKKFAKERKAPFIVPSGSIEIRQTTKAFNEMTTQIQKFIDERTLMLSSISHDLKTSLTKMNLLLELNKIQNHTELQAEIANMDNMVNAYLNFAKLDYQKLTLTPINIKHFLKKITSQETFANLKISTKFQQTPKTFAIHTHSMARVFENILNNAKKFASKVVITVDNYSEHNIKITVEDNGKGIPTNDLPNVFQPFYKINKARTAEKGSVGLGLYIVKDIINQHGGEITLSKSELGGLKLTIILPIN